MEVRSGDRHRIDAAIVEDPANVLEGWRPLLSRRFNHLAAAFDNGIVNITEPGNLDVWHFQVGGDVRFAATVESNNSNPDGVVLARQRTRLERYWQRHRRHEEMPAIDLVHRLSFADAAVALVILA